MRHSTLPDLMAFNNGRRVRNAAEWPARRREVGETIVGIEYGGMPPAPEQTRFEELHNTKVEWLSGAGYISLRVVASCPREVTFMLYLTVPEGKGPFPVVLTGDGCWRYVTDEVTSEVLRRGYILAQFNRVEIAPEAYNNDRV
ncbi:MAG: hypothetical protein PHR35_16220, partial [Kiritimatiellae bacterium]|nr:hypothetical protein [Kiritimatiellia bacterium]